MISIKTDATSDYCLCIMLDNETEIVFGATEKMLPKLIKRVTNGDEKLPDLFCGRRKLGSFAVDFNSFSDNTGFLLENATMLYSSIFHSVPLDRESETVSELNSFSENSQNAYCKFITHAVWNMFRREKHLCMGKVYQPISRKRQIEYADNFRSKFKELLSLNHAKKLISDMSKINIDRQSETTVITAKAVDFETLYAEYIAELKRRKIYCRFCKNCGKATLFYSKNKMLCDSCYTANRRNAPIEHKKRANSDSVLRSHKSKIQQYYNYSHSVHFKNSSPEQQQAFLDFFADFKAEAKVLLKKYRNGEIKKKEMDKWFIKQNDIYTKVYNSSGND